MRAGQIHKIFITQLCVPFSVFISFIGVNCMDVQEWHPTDLYKVLMREGKLEPARARFYMAELVGLSPTLLYDMN
jgi:hypothetical protein